jgi:hypothetical protein
MPGVDTETGGRTMRVIGTARRRLRAFGLRGPWAVGLAGFVVLTGYLGVVLVAMSRTTYDTWGGLLVAPLLVLLAMPAMAGQARRERDRTIFWLLLAGLLLRFVGALARQFVAFDLYGGIADASGYHDAGVRLAALFAHGDFATGMSPITGTNFIKLVTGIFYTVTGPTKLGGYLFFSWLGFWGTYFFYRAFTVAVPEGRSRSYARLVLFLPSLIFWPAGLGKDAWMVFALGIVAYGGARLLSGSVMRGVLICGLGIWTAGLVRPHVAGMAGLAIVAGAVLKRPSERFGQTAPIVRAVSIVAVAVAAWLFVSQASAFLKESQLNVDQGVSSVLATIATRTSEGGSEFAPTIVHSPVQFPLAAIQVLFRPFAFEAHNLQSLVIALEGTFVLLLSAIRWRSIVAAVRSATERPFVAACLAYTILFVVAFSAIANFGILARERDQLLPFFFVLLCLPARDRA